MGSTKPPTLLEIAFLFLKLGSTAFGGPAAHVAMMEQEFVARRGWLTKQEFLDRLGASNLIPGPSSTEMAIHIGFSRRGWLGLIVAGVCFIAPAALIVCLIAGVYVRFGSLPQVGGVLYAVKPVVIAIVVQAFWNLSRTALKSYWLAAIGIGCAGAYAMGVSALLVLLLAGIAAMAPLWRNGTVAACFSIIVGTVDPVQTVPFGLWRLFLTFLKIGSVLFGSGYVLLAFLRSDFVDHLHWLTQQQLLDAVAVGQVTPGPVFTTATFIGYIVGGFPGAVVATVGIFVPAFLLVAVSGPLISRIRKSPRAGAFLDGVIVASLALMGVVAWQLGRAAIVDWKTAVLAIVSLFVLLRWNINSAWLVLGAGAFGLIGSLRV